MLGRRWPSPRPSWDAPRWPPDPGIPGTLVLGGVYFCTPGHLPFPPPPVRVGWIPSDYRPPHDRLPERRPWTGGVAGSESVVIRFLAWKQAANRQAMRGRRTVMDIDRLPLTNRPKILTMSRDVRESPQSPLRLFDADCGFPRDERCPRPSSTFRSGCPQHSTSTWRPERERRRPRSTPWLSASCEPRQTAVKRRPGGRRSWPRSRSR